MMCPSAICNEKKLDKPKTDAVNKLAKESIFKCLANKDMPAIPIKIMAKLSIFSPSTQPKISVKMNVGVKNLVCWFANNGRPPDEYGFHNGN